MSIIIFGDIFTFPEGNAATNRVHSYAKGFKENGINVHVICFGNEYIKEFNGNENGIYFYHPFRQKIRNKYFLKRRWQKFIKYFRAIRLFWEINKKDKIIATICYTNLLFTQAFTFLISKFLQFKIVLERSEHPLRNYQGSISRKTEGKIKVYLEANFCNGIICISEYLMNFYRKIGIPEKRLFLVPSTVDTERFKANYDSILSFPYISYCGSLTLLKDGVDVLIKSFSKISEKYPEINLVLIGKGDQIEEESFIKELVVTMGLEKRVIFLGQTPRDKIPMYLKNAKILALARPKSIIANAGFPSKLTEYLATGIPVVVTEVGEIPFYLKDNENAFLCMPDSIKAFADKMDFVLSNYEFSKRVGLKGRELTETIFNYNFQARRLITFFNSV